ncbi:hypothetical protein [Roseomonas chloroacetimidivorans]|uniref:hypothetical protein n=1 Tax=Roseomonas chloroacetimidivorans TaxID=1766656 RepID=UPI003C760D31
MQATQSRLSGGEARIALQEAIVAALEHRGSQVMLPVARKLLETMRRAQQVSREEPDQFPEP